MEPRSLYRLFLSSVERDPSKVAYQVRRDERWTETTWGEQRRAVEAVSRSLLALGLARGERVAILGATCLEWVQADVGIACAGGVTVGIYPSNLAAECRYILDHSGAVGIFVEDEAQLAKVLSAEPARRPWIVRFDGPGDAGQGVMSWSEFLERGQAVSAARAAEVAGELGPDDVASIVYTSGTTGQPKGAMITHGNLLFTIDCAARCLPVEPWHVTLLFLPLAHVYARLLTHLFMFRGATVAFGQDLTHLPRNLKEVRPHFIASVPRIYEKVHENVMQQAAAGGRAKRALFDWALATGARAGEHRRQGQPVPAGLRLRLALADRLVLHRVRDFFGGRMSWCVSGAAPLDRRVAEFFQACGITVLEGLGMTENTSFTNVNRIDDYRFGTVGPVAPGVEMRIAEDGEVLFRGPNVMRGYLNDAAGTAEAIDGEGWLHTGDIGRIDPDGHLVITDRKKDLIITAGGKNIAPQRIEQALRTSPYVSHAVAYGDRRKYVTALITLDRARVREWAAASGAALNGEEELSQDPRVRELISEAVKESNRQLASFETVKRFHILPRDFTIEDGELTPTLKLKRKAIVARYQNELDRLYEGPPA